MTLILAFFLIALLAFANGANDVSKSVATLVGSGVTDYRHGIRWRVFAEMSAAWVATLPLAGLVATVCYWLFALVH